jgi:hypothetical protein
VIRPTPATRAWNVATDVERVGAEVCVMALGLTERTSTVVR